MRVAPAPGTFWKGPGAQKCSRKNVFYDFPDFVRSSPAGFLYDFYIIRELQNKIRHITVFTFPLHRARLVVAAGVVNTLERREGEGNDG